MRQTSRYGWRKDRPDRRDYKLQGRKLCAEQLPPSADLRAACPPVYDQGDLGSCTANAIAAAIDFDRNRQGLSFVSPSRLMIYYDERVIENTVESDCGAELRDGIKSVAAQGACPESLWPYADAKLFVKPDAACYEAAQKDLVSSYHSLSGDLVSLKSALSAGYPFVFGITVFQSFESDAVASLGIVPEPGPSEPEVGGHAMLAVGYSDLKQAFLVRNSWGASWGWKGYCWIPYAYLGDANLAADFWVINAVRSLPPDTDESFWKRALGFLADAF